MAKSITKYSIFLGSPSDLKEERSAIEEVIKELNLTYGSRLNLIIELLKWETHSAPGISTSAPQGLINEDIGDEYDIFLGIIWKRFGTPTSNAGSGTEEEFNKALHLFSSNKNIQILFYFKNSPVLLKEVNWLELSKIENFKKALPPNLLYWDFDTCEELKNFLRLHIPMRIDTLIKNSSQRLITNNQEIGNADSFNETEHYGLMDYNEMFESLINDTLISLTAINESTTIVGEEMTKKAEEISRITQQKSPNKIVLTEIFKRVAKLMNDYSNRLAIENPIFYHSFEEAIKAGSNLINLSEDFASEKTITDLLESKEAILNFRKILPEVIVSMHSLYKSIEDLPRIQKDINIAKSQLLIQLEGLIEKLNKSQSLTEEFSNAIGAKIDKLKLMSTNSNI
ncbi:MAG: DUF4062 domain-containing protein [Cytophaga sp.]|uniref:DUF4062 domain-containing protein n=1 Tax=Cytophaga sp. TaxID=29535 RepID=UPI003F7F4E6D